MNRPLITASCPNCGTDASKHNKVLYDGIFLICHNCGYGWYYNIEVFNPKKVNHYNATTAPLSTLQSTAVYNKAAPHVRSRQEPKRKTKANKQNNASFPNYEHSQTHHDKYKHGNNLSNSKAAANNHKDNTVPLKRTSTYSSNSSYSDNFYYEAPKNSAPPLASETKNHKPKNNKAALNNNFSNSSPKLEEPHNKQIFSSKENKASIANITTNASATSTELNKQQNPTKLNNYKELPKDINNQVQKTNTAANSKTQQQIINNETANNITINLKNPPKTDNNHKENTENYLGSKALNAEENSLNENNTLNSAFANNVEQNKIITQEGLTTTQINNSLNENNHLNINHEEPVSEHNTTNNTNPFFKIDEIKTQVEPILIDSLQLEESITQKETTVNSTTLISEDLLANDVNTQEQLQFGNSPALNPSISRAAVNEFNFNLTQKENLGLTTPTSLLKIEEQEQYNIKQYQEPLIEFKNLVPDIKSLGRHLKHALLSLLQFIITVFTRPDLLLRALAYAVILGSVITFLIYSNNSKKRTIAQSEIKNSANNSNFKAEYSQNLKDKDNLALSGVRPLEESTEKSLNSNSNVVAKDKDENKIIAFQKEQGKNQQQPKLANEKLNNSSNSKTNLINTLQAQAKYGLLAFKQMQQNSFSKVKIYQNSSYWQGEHNNTLISNTTLFNEDRNNSYLVRSLEVVFLSKSGETLGKRTIIANQLINNNSAINLSLTVNSPPLNTSKTFVFVKDKSKL